MSSVGKVMDAKAMRVSSAPSIPHTLIQACTRRRSNVYYVTFFFISVLALLNTLHYVTTSTENLSPQRKMSAINILGQRIIKSSDVKKILYWTPFMGSDQAERQRECLKRYPCDVKCEVTSNKSDVRSVDAVEFHQSDLWVENWSIGTKRLVELPNYRHHDQVWVLYNLEPPPNIFADLRVLNGVFNWTLWYRSDATVVQPYGAASLLSDVEKSKARSLYAGKDVFSEKTKSIIGVISNCADRGRRYQLINEMQKYLEIDMYGKCYKRPCDTGAQNLKECKIIKDYKFFLSFENSHCKDYITEKYWFVLYQGLIPIVNWKHVNTSLVIPNSYINVYDFPSIKEASAYINKVMLDKDLYNSYFTWKLFFKMDEACSACTLCKALNNRALPAQTIDNMAGWISNDYCGQASRWSTIKDNANSWLFDAIGGGRA